MLPDPALAARTEAAEKERLEAARAALAREQAGALARGGGGGGGGGGRVLGVCAAGRPPHCCEPHPFLTPFYPCHLGNRKA